MLPRKRFATTLDALVQNTGLVRQEFRDRTAFYQIISEFLVPWIRDQKADRARIEAERTLAHERQEAAERLAQEREAAEQKLALQSAEADRLRAQISRRLCAKCAAAAPSSPCCSSCFSVVGRWPHGRLGRPGGKRPSPFRKKMRPTPRGRWLRMTRNQRSPRRMRRERRSEQNVQALG